MSAVFPDDQDDERPPVDDRTLDLFNTTEAELPGHDQASAAASAAKQEAPQPTLFDEVEEWREHWRSMPKFEQRDLTPRRSLYVHFERDEDVAAFSALVGQRITEKTRMIWYPEAKIGSFADKRWVDAQFAARVKWGGKDAEPPLDPEELDESLLDFDPNSPTED